MPYGIIRIQEDRQFSVAANSTLQQGENAAANVLPYQFITPFIRVKNSPAPTGAGVTLILTFSSAAILLYPDESVQTGSRFVDVATFIIPPGGAATPVNAGTYAQTPMST